MDKIILQIRDLGVPYPQKHQLELEVRQDLEMQGKSQEDFLFLKDDLKELEQIHSTRLYSLFSRFESSQRRRIEIASAFFPLAVVVLLTIKEDTVIGFIREGGAGMLVILAIGVFLLGKEGLNIFRLLVLKDHKPANLRIDTWSVWVGCLALMCVGLGWTTLGMYVSANAVIESNGKYDLLLIGAKESLAAVVLSSLLSALVLLAHYAIRQLLVGWRAPIADESRPA